MLEFKFDTQLLLAGEQLSEDEIFDYITATFEGDSLLAVVQIYADTKAYEEIFMVSAER